LVPDKSKAFSELYRILKPGGHFCISDIVMNGSLSENLQKAAEFYTGCIAGALLKNDYVGKIEQAGFKNINIKKQKSIDLPDSILLSYITQPELDEMKKIPNLIESITVYAEKA